MFQVAAIQITPILSDVQGNLKRGIQYMRGIEKEADLIVFPELWTTGYYLSKQTFQKLAETSDGPTINQLQYAQSTSCFRNASTLAQINCHCERSAAISYTSQQIVAVAKASSQ